MTLVELLVVIIILTTIVAAAIPIMSPSNDDRRLREASRSLNTFITGAQTRAIAAKRPFGIGLKRLSQDTGRDDPNDPDNDNGVCLEVFYVEQPAPYAGFDENSRACVALNPNIAGTVLVRFVTRGTSGPNLPPGWTGDLFPPNLIRPGDIAEINGTRYELLDPAPFNAGGVARVSTNISQGPIGYFLPTGLLTTILARPINDSGQQIDVRYDAQGREIGSVVAADPPYWTRPARYQILRQATFTSDEPYQLPEGAAIDLRASGIGVNKYFYVPGENDNSHPILVLFTPEGRVQRVRYSQAPVVGNESAMFDSSVADNLFLLVGRRENIPAPLPSDDPTLVSARVSPPVTDEERAELRDPINWLNGSSRWVVIGSQSGRVVTVENGFVDLPEFATASSPSESTEIMRNTQIQQAREFTREMAQLGGR